MQADQLALFAHQLARNTFRLTVPSRTRFPDCPINQYWATAKCRVQNWQAALGQLDRALISVDPDDHPYHWNMHAPMVAEIFFGDMVTSVWTSLLKSAGSTDPSPIIDDIFESERATRDRAAGILVRAFDLNLRRRDPIAVIDQLTTARKQADIWVDLLLGYVWPQKSVYACGILPHRVEQNSTNIVMLRDRNALVALDRRIAVEMKDMFAVMGFKPTSNGEQNAQICEAIKNSLGGATLVEAIGELK